MEGDQKNKNINPVVVVVVLLQLIFMILAGITIGSILSRKVEVAKIGVQGYSSAQSEKEDDEKVKVVNLDGSLDETKKAVIGGVLYKVAVLNNGVGISNRDGKVREGSVYSVYIEDLDLYFLNFIVDIEELKQSYRVVYRWTDNYPNKSAPADDPAMAFCLDDDELVYGGFDCKDDYSGHGKDLVVYGVLRYKLFGDFTVGLVSDVIGGEALEFRINTATDDSEAKDFAVSRVSKYLSSLGFDINDFRYTVGRYTCCQVDYKP